MPQYIYGPGNETKSTDAEDSQPESSPSIVHPFVTSDNRVPRNSASPIPRIVPSIMGPGVF